MKLAALGAIAIVALGSPSLASAQTAPPNGEPPAANAGVHLAPPPAQAFTYHSPVLYPTIQWLALQLVPNAEIAIGRQRTIGIDGTVESKSDVTWGLRWEITPLLWSWGLHRKQQRWRTMVVDPLARVSGSLEVTTAFEYIAGDISTVLVRPGVRGYFPLLHRGEYLATSIGTSIYRFDNDLRVAYDVGAHFLAGIFGINVTIAPTHTPLTSIITFRLKYF